MIVNTNYRSNQQHTKNGGRWWWQLAARKQKQQRRRRLTTTITTTTVVTSSKHTKVNVSFTMWRNRCHRQKKQSTSIQQKPLLRMRTTKKKQCHRRRRYCRCHCGGLRWL
jgi:hypothetical protein